MSELIEKKLVGFRQNETTTVSIYSICFGVGASASFLYWVCVVFLAERSTIDIVNCLRQIVERQNGKLFQFGSSFSTKG